MGVPSRAGQKRKRLAQIPKVTGRKQRADEYYSSSSEGEAEPLQDDVTQLEIDAEVDATGDLSDEGVQLPNLQTTSTGVVDAKGDIVPADDDEDDEEEDGVAIPKDTLSDLDDDDTGDEEDEDAEEDEDLSDAELSISDNESASTATRERRLQKRNDPTAFANSITRILDSKLTTGQRTDPILSRSKTASTNIQELADAKLTAKAKRKMREDKHKALEKGRQKDVLGLEREDIDTGKVMGKETELRRTAQKGVVKLFNAVRAAQMQGLEAERSEREKGTVGMDKRKERVEDMGKKAFLDLLVDSGGAAG